MMLSRARTGVFRTWALLVCLGLFSTSVDALLHATQQRDLDLVTPIGVHDPTSHGFRPVGDEEGAAPHCVACHLSRSARSVDPVASRSAAAPDESAAAREEHSAPLAPSPHLAQLPARAPPA
jgi:hypothetical protein